VRRAARAGLAAACLALAPAAGAAGDVGFAAFLAQWRAALARDDAGAVADLTQLPFLFEGAPRDRAGFVAIYPALFTKPVRECLATAEPVAEDDRFVASCGPSLFYFGRSGPAWRLLEFAADPEAEP
jgi:hypothetical protein